MQGGRRLAHILSLFTHVSRAVRPSQTPISGLSCHFPHILLIFTFQPSDPNMHMGHDPVGSIACRFRTRLRIHNPLTSSNPPVNEGKLSLPQWDGILPVIDRRDGEGRDGVPSTLWHKCAGAAKTGDGFR